MTEQSSGPRGHFQFSIRTLLVVTAAVAAVFWVITSEPGWQSFMSLVFLAIMFATVAIIVAVLTHGRLRVFWAGASAMLVSGGLVALTGVLWLQFATGRPSVEGYEFTEKLLLLSSFLKPSVAVFWLFAPLNGLVCALIHWLFFEQRRIATVEHE